MLEVTQSGSEPTVTSTRKHCALLPSKGGWLMPSGWRELGLRQTSEKTSVPEESLKALQNHLPAPSHRSLILGLWSTVSELNVGTQWRWKAALILYINITKCRVSISLYCTKYQEKMLTVFVVPKSVGESGESFPFPTLAGTWVMSFFPKYKFSHFPVEPGLAKTNPRWITREDQFVRFS